MKCLFAAEKDNCRKTQLVKTSINTNYGVPNPMCATTTQLLHLWLREHWGREGSYTQYFAIYGCLNKTQIMIILQSF